MLVDGSDAGGLVAGGTVVDASVVVGATVDVVVVVSGIDGMVVTGAVDSGDPVEVVASSPPEHAASAQTAATAIARFRLTGDTVVAGDGW